MKSVKTQKLYKIEKKKTKKSIFLEIVTSSKKCMPQQAMVWATPYKNTIGLILMAESSLTPYSATMSTMMHLLEPWPNRLSFKIGW